jgi:carbamoyltransferase
MALICGIKTTHDGAVALVEDNALVLVHEIEKIDNNPRHARLHSTELVAEILARAGRSLVDVDRFVIDGWWADGPAVTVPIVSNGRARTIPVAGYREERLSDDLFQPGASGVLPVNGRAFPYQSYTHVAGHVAGAYCSSPWARSREASYVLVWDGGMPPRLHYCDPGRGGLRCDNLGPVMAVMGNAYPAFGAHFDPFRGADGPRLPPTAIGERELELPGKIMAYCGLGTVREDLLALFAAAEDAQTSVSRDASVAFARAFLDLGPPPYSSADVLTSYQTYLGSALLAAVTSAVRADGSRASHLCVAGGCALNIVWNTMLRESGVFDSVWVPPCPNDSGSALGMACIEMVRATGDAALDWTVYCGPPACDGGPCPGWRPSSCSVDELARLLHGANEPVVFLSGRAELGPRALGNRSILASAATPEMKGRLNRIKKREDYRPVAPICLEDRARDVFQPGTPDPYMLFTHRVRDEWLARLPAIVHVDGTARLQTLDDAQNPLVARLLREYEAVSGLPALCNTSANAPGRGFFPDARSAMEWGEVPAVWCEGTLYRRG